MQYKFWRFFNLPLHLSNILIKPIVEIDEPYWVCKKINIGSKPPLKFQTQKSASFLKRF